MPPCGSKWPRVLVSLSRGLRSGRTPTKKSKRKFCPRSKKFLRRYRDFLSPSTSSLLERSRTLPFGRIYRSTAKQNNLFANSQNTSNNTPSFRRRQIRLSTLDLQNCTPLFSIFQKLSRLVRQ